MSSIETCINTLYRFLTEERKQRFEDVLEKRTRYISLVLEDIFQSRNASAIMRSADGFGIQDLHIIEDNHKWTGTRSVSKGASSWLTIHKYFGNNPTSDCIRNLKAQGVRIVATSPHEGGYTPDTLPLDKPVAIVMGTELTGLTTNMLSQIDDFVEINMHGFSESFNVSVAAAIILNRLRTRLDNMEVDNGLSEEEKQKLRLIWAYRTVKDPKAIMRHYNMEPPFEI
ncbi:MAG: rRNA methyltransferase [Crocinitomicaceae bacterium]|nr:rRNA methyltransferase [Crocinitomicaceae bacterium]|tara:strand:+ start:194 stop:874 length:681 start_codon:yes stop_codon:yes gene_type:complete